MSLRRFQQAVVAAELNDSAQDVARRMRESHVGSVVVTKSGRPIGILTDRDLALRVVAEGRDPNRTLVADIVTYDAATIPSSASVETAARMMRDLGVRRLPIVDEDGRVTGIVTADDLTIFLSRQLADVGAGLEENVESDESR